MSKQAKPVATKVTKRITHDSLSVSVKFPSGGTLQFRVTRAGELLTVSLSNDEETLREQTKTIREWVKLRKGENNGERIERIAAICKMCASGTDLVKAMAS